MTAPIGALLLATTLAMVPAAPAPIVTPGRQQGGCPAWLDQAQDEQLLSHSLARMEIFEDSTAGEVRGAVRLTNEHETVSLRVEISARLRAELKEACGPAVPRPSCACVITRREVVLGPAESATIHCTFEPVDEELAATARSGTTVPGAHVAANITGLRCGPLARWRPPSGFGLGKIRIPARDRLRMVTRHSL